MAIRAPDGANKSIRRILKQTYIVPNDHGLTQILYFELINHKNIKSYIYCSQRPWPMNGRNTMGFPRKPGMTAGGIKIKA